MAARVSRTEVMQDALELSADDSALAGEGKGMTWPDVRDKLRGRWGA
jgi:hypothetical protein